MFSELFTVELPNFLQSLMKVKFLTFYSYPFLIVIGALVAYNYLKFKSDIPKEILSLKFIILVSAFVFIGGKLFLFLEKPTLFISKPNSINSSGFVFYGSFITVLIFLFIYLKTKQYNVYKILDILSITFLIIHFFGRIGCFLAGCCYGNITNSSFGIIFKTTEPFRVHPTQLYEASILLIILIILLINKSKKTFNGQVFLTYIILYAFGRLIIENFRGDIRGTLFNNLISYSQFIAMIFIIIAIIKYFNLKSTYISNN